VPDFATQAARQRRELPEFRKRLLGLSARSWPLHAQIDYLMLQAEMDQLDFQLNVIRQPSRNPDFYTTQAISRIMRQIGGRFQAAPGITSPYSAERAAAILKALEEVPAILKQAPAALTEPVPEMADMAVETLAEIEKRSAEFARVVGEHLPEPYRTQIAPAVEKAAASLVEHREWIRAHRSKMSAPYAIGRPAFEWYVKRVLMYPYDSDQLLIQAEMERNRNWAFFQFERQKNRHLPEPGKMFSVAPLRAARTNAEYSEWKDATDVQSRLWAEEHELFTRPPELGPMRHGQGGVAIEPFGFMGFPKEPLAPGTYTQFVVEPDHWWAHTYWILGHRRDPGDNHPHNEYPGHRFESAVSQRATCELRRGHNTRGDSWPYYMEELQLQLDFPYVRGPRAREIQYGLAIMRAERVYAAVKMADGSMTPDQVERHMMETVPWMEPYVAKRHEVWRKFVTPADVLKYQLGKYEINKLLRDRMRQLGDGFNLREFHDQLLATGQIPVALARWELTGANDEIQYLWDRTPVPGVKATSSPE
jgi:hypothetical protein